MDLAAPLWKEFAREMPESPSTVRLAWAWTPPPERCSREACELEQRPATWPSWRTRTLCWRRSTRSTQPFSLNKRQRRLLATLSCSNQPLLLLLLPLHSQLLVAGALQWLPPLPPSRRPPPTPRPRLRPANPPQRSRSIRWHPTQALSLSFLPGNTFCIVGSARAWIRPSMGGRGPTESSWGRGRTGLLTEQSQIRMRTSTATSGSWMCATCESTRRGRTRSWTVEQ
mmetsp:Transcript_2337/g.5522  ORF Transcript_2337/g.5522 Transcript_2337/m.5522 type:complete len:227 (+) Transcript_2337:2-682(+)